MLIKCCFGAPHDKIIMIKLRSLDLLFCTVFHILSIMCVNGKVTPSHLTSTHSFFYGSHLNGGPAVFTEAVGGWG